MTMDERLAELEKENERLQSENYELRTKSRKSARTRARVAGFAISYAVRVLMGAGLVNSIQGWLKAKSVRDPLPVEETAEMLAAILRRVVRVGITGLVMAALPVVFLIWQSLLMRSQNAEIRVQNTTLQKQVDQQVSDTLIVRRAQLLDTIYEEVCVGATKPRCRPKAHLRARQEAVLAFVEIERGQGVRAELQMADLSGANLLEANLSGANLFGANLFGANFSGANLSSTFLNEANLSKAILKDADIRKASLSNTILKGADLNSADLSSSLLSGANLGGAKFYGTYFHGASLYKADFSGTNLVGSFFLGANLGGADLRKAEITQSQINEANGDKDTKLPLGITRPANWSKSILNLGPILPHLTGS